MKNPVKAYFDCECDNDLFRVWNDENWIDEFNRFRDYLNGIILESEK